jgi:hypothetical protein
MQVAKVVQTESFDDVQTGLRAICLGDGDGTVQPGASTGDLRGVPPRPVLITEQHQLVVI